MNKPSGNRIEHQQPVNCFCSYSSRLAKTFGSSAGRRSQHNIKFGRLCSANQLSQHSSLPDSWTAGYNTEWRFRHHINRGKLSWCKFYISIRLNPADCHSRVFFHIQNAVQMFRQFMLRIIKFHWISHITVYSNGSCFNCQIQRIVQILIDVNPQQRSSFVQ